ncbi:MAG: DUF2844 domain-containing protein [Janthinobacterium lividum]
MELPMVRSRRGGSIERALSTAQRTTLRGALMLAALSVTVPAHAVLGGAPMTPPDGASPGRAFNHVASGSGASSTTAPYSVRSTTLANGTVVNEYIGSDGKVFGIGWNGPRVPDLPSMLGSYFAPYTQGIEAERANGQHSHGPVSVAGVGLIVHSGGHPGMFAGQAYLPQALPAGVDPTDIQ